MLVVSSGAVAASCPSSTVGSGVGVAALVLVSTSTSTVGVTVVGGAVVGGTGAVVVTTTGERTSSPPRVARVGASVVGADVVAIVSTGAACARTGMATPTPATAPRATAPEATLAWAAMARVGRVAPPVARRGSSPRNGICASHATGPAATRRRPREIWRKARTTTGSNWVPEHRVSSARALAADIGRL